MRTIYVETHARQHPRAMRILERFASATIIECDSYTQVFNRRAQNFRLQKSRPPLILALKRQGFVLPAPPDYGIAEHHNYYFSTTLNCPYDCRYCFLQGMYRSAAYVVFVNYEDFIQDIDIRLRSAISDGANSGCTNSTGNVDAGAQVNVADAPPAAPVWFNSGYDSDSLALNAVTGFLQYFVPKFAQRPGAVLELRTKSARVKPLLQLSPITNVVCAFSVSPATVVNALEHRAPSLSKRIQAIKTLQSAGWRVALRIEPVIAWQEWQDAYTELLNEIEQQLDIQTIHSVSYGIYRMPTNFHQTSAKLYPDDVFFAGPFVKIDQQMTYTVDTEHQIKQFFDEQLVARFGSQRVYRCG